jgi:hypothetical protein
MPRKKKKTADDSARARLGMTASGGAEEEAAEPIGQAAPVKLKLPESMPNVPAWVKDTCIGIPPVPPTGKVLMTAAQVKEAWLMWHDQPMITDPVYWLGLWRVPHPTLNKLWVAAESRNRGMTEEEYITMISQPSAPVPDPIERKQRGRKKVDLAAAPIEADEAGPVIVQEALITLPAYNGKPKVGPVGEKRQTAAAGAGLVQEAMF